MKPNQILFTVAFLFCVLVFNAQDKYEFMAICYVPRDKEITLSINGKQLLKEEVVSSSTADRLIKM